MLNHRYLFVLLGCVKIQTLFENRPLYVESYLSSHTFDMRKNAVFQLEQLTL